MTEFSLARENVDFTLSTSVGWCESLLSELQKRMLQMKVSNLLFRMDMAASFLNWIH
jgi:hypothetical protein